MTKDDRTTIRLTDDQKKKIKALMDTGRYKTISELLRRFIDDGIKKELKNSGIEEKL